MSINRNLVSASLADLRRLSLLAALAQAGSVGEAVDPAEAAKTLEPVFSGLPTCLDEDITALCEEKLIIRDLALASTPSVTVLNPGCELAERLKTSVESDQDALTAVVASMVLYYMHTHKDRARSTSTESLRDAGITVFGMPLPDGCVEEATTELYDLGLIEGTKGNQGGLVIPSRVTSKGRTVLLKGGPILVPEESRAGTSSVYNTTINGGIQGQNIAVASQGDVHQDATINIDQATADLRIAVNDLYTALAGQEDLQDKIDALLEKLDEAEDQGSRSRMARALSGLSRLAGRVAAKGVDTTVTMAVTEAATPLLKSLGS